MNLILIPIFPFIKFKKFESIGMFLLHEFSILILILHTLNALLF